MEAAVVDLELDLGGQRVDHRDTHAVQTAGDGVGVGIEFAARVQLGHDHLDGGTARGVHVGGDATTVVDYLHTTVLEQRHLHLGGVAGHRLIDRVVDDLPDQMV